MAYRLHYFPFRGRAEWVRLLFHAANVDFEDVRIRKDAFMELKGAGPGKLTFGSLPALQDDDMWLVNGAAIMAHIGNKHGAAPSDPQQAARALSLALGAEDLRTAYFKLFGDDATEKQAEFLEGNWKKRWLPAFEWALEQGGGDTLFDKWSYADIAVWDALDSIVTFIDGATMVGFPRVQAFYSALPEIANFKAYLAERPDK